MFSSTVLCLLILSTTRSTTTVEQATTTHNSEVPAWFVSIEVANSQATVTCRLRGWDDKEVVDDAITEKVLEVTEGSVLTVSCITCRVNLARNTRISLATHTVGPVGVF